MTSSSSLAPGQNACSACGHKIEGQFVRALNGHYHLDCFRCQQVVAEKFFPHTAQDGTPQVFCEKDYFRRLDLLCAKCGGALRGAHINALGKKYHLEHFTCSVCPTVFRQHDSYYERDGQVYCQLHYSALVAAKCGGCQTPVLGNFVEVSKDKRTEQWHPECYMIYKLWNVKVTEKSLTAVPKAADGAKDGGTHMVAEKIAHILHVLSAFEESSANCISDMLVRVSQEDFEETVLQAARFVDHIDALFSALDTIELQLAEYNDHTGLQHAKEPKQLAKRVVHFLSLLSYVQDELDSRQEGTKKWISLVTSLAHMLKIVIRAALTGALKLEQTHGRTRTIVQLLDQLASCEQQDVDRAFLHDRGPDVKLDLCSTCSKSVEEGCYKHENRRWHASCFRCTTCGVDLGTSYQDARYQEESGRLFCGAHAPSSATGGFERVTQLRQYVFLLRCALKRLSFLLNVPANAQTEPTSNIQVEDSEGGATELGEPTMQGSMPDHVREVMIHPPLMRTDSGQLHVGENGHVRNMSPSGLDNGRTYPESPMLVRQNQQLADSTGYMLSELSALDHWAVRQLAAQAVHPLLGGHFTLNELMDIASARKQSVWARMVDAIKKPAKVKEGVFGVPLEVLFEKYSVDSDLGPGAGQVRIPLLLDKCIRTLQKSDLGVEGIFRKNGNIRGLTTLSADLDRDPLTIDLSQENPVQVAALMKKFFRELPEPLLTFKLHRLFIATQSTLDILQ
ncbi:hypothetical protein BC832DRAFT_177906 [Gaertneriomyces semiglobifer]|nr:hypothetical protein BC832DRAFT_177906 [Gaertneriomyces semiglobifer]